MNTCVLLYNSFAMQPYKLKHNIDSRNIANISVLAKKRTERVNRMTYYVDMCRNN